MKELIVDAVTDSDDEFDDGNDEDTRAKVDDVFNSGDGRGRKLSLNFVDGLWLRTPHRSWMSISVDHRTPWL